MSTYKTPYQKKPPDQYDNCPVFLANYLAYLSNNENQRPATVIECYVNIRDFCQYIQALRSLPAPPDSKEYKKIDVSNLALHWLTITNQDEVYDYIDLLQNICGNAETTISKKVLLLRKFFQYLDDNKTELNVRFPYGNPFRDIQTAKPPQSIAHVLPMAQVQKLLNCTTGTTAVRDKAMIHILVTTGLTLLELVRLNWGDLDQNVKLLTIRRDDSFRSVALTDGCLESILKYKRDLCTSIDRDDTDAPYEITEKSPMFQAEGTHRRLNPRSVSLRITKTATTAGLHDPRNPINANSLRDTAVAIALQQYSAAERPYVLSAFGFRNHASAARFANVPSAHGTNADLLFKGLSNSPLSELK